jgi:hypothetical protein
MAIRSIKEIIDNKVYRIDKKDRKIFQNGDIQSFFGLNEDDVIEFILYDVNDNQLPQGDWGLVRYILLNSENISDYFLIKEDTELSYNKLPSEYYIDIERLIGEAGYNNGIFKVQISLLNNRLGTDGIDDRIWVNEISPSRTEIRVLPLNKKTTPLKLANTYNAFVTNKSFWRDIELYIDQFIDSIDGVSVYNNLQQMYAETDTIQLINTEFGQPLDEIIGAGISLAKEAIKFEFQNKVSDPTDSLYGEPLPDGSIIEYLSIDEIIAKSKKLIYLSMDKVLPKRDLNNEVIANLKSANTQFQVQQVLQTIESDSVITTSEIEYDIETRGIETNVSREVVYEIKIEDDTPNTGNPSNGVSSGGGGTSMGNPDGNNDGSSTSVNEDSPASGDDDTNQPIITTTFQYG